VLRVFEGWDYEENHPAALRLTPTPSPARPCARRPYSFVGRDGALLAAAARLHQPARQLAAAGCGAPDAAPPLLLRASDCATSRPKAAARASSTRWASQRLAATPAPADVEVLAIARRKKPLEAARRARRDEIGHVGVFAACSREAGLEPARVEELRDASRQGCRGRP